MKLKLVVPYHKQPIDPQEDRAIIMFPESEKTPAESLQYLEDLYESCKEVPDVVIVSGSPYIMEYALKLFKEREVIYSNGIYENSDNDGFWTHFAKPMADIIFK